MLTYEKANDDNRVLPEGRTIKKQEEVRVLSQEPAQGGGGAKKKRSRPPLTIERLREVLDYNPETGEFRWKISISRNPAGSKAGNPNATTGYWRIGIGGKYYLAHRLAWLFVHGMWPTKDLDHIDRNRTNNALCNLREVSDTQNAHNRKVSCTNTSGHTGIYFSHKYQRWYAQIKIGGKTVHLAFTKSKGDAVKARKEAEMLYFPEIYKQAGTKRSA